MGNVGNTIKNIRLAHGFSLKSLSDLLKINISILSRIEKGERLPTEEQMNKLCQHFKENAHELRVHWLSTKIITDIENYKEFAIEALQVAEQTIQYKKD